MGHNFICILCTCKSGFARYTHYTLQLNTQRRHGSKVAEVHVADAKANADFEMSEEEGGLKKKVLIEFSLRYHGYQFAQRTLVRSARRATANAGGGGVWSLAAYVAYS